MFGHYGAMLETMPRDSVGEGLILAVRYFNTGELPDTKDPMAFAVFLTLKPDIDEAFSAYADSIENGKKGAANRKNR